MLLSLLLPLLPERHVRPSLFSCTTGSVNLKITDFGLSREMAKEATRAMTGKVSGAKEGVGQEVTRAMTGKVSGAKEGVGQG